MFSQDLYTLGLVIMIGILESCAYNYNLFVTHTQCPIVIRRKTNSDRYKFIPRQSAIPRSVSIDTIR